MFNLQYAHSVVVEELGYPLRFYSETIYFLVGERGHPSIEKAEPVSFGRPASYHCSTVGLQ